MTSKDVANAAGNHQAAERASTGSALRERLKETTSLYESRRRTGSELPLEDSCRQIFDHLIPAMHFPAIASAMIELDGKRFTSENYREGNTHELQANIVVLDRLRGHLRVFYPDNTSFLLPEEQELIDAIAGDLERWLKEVHGVYEIQRGRRVGVAAGGCLPANLEAHHTRVAIPPLGHRGDRTGRQAICQRASRARRTTILEDHCRQQDT